MMFKIPSFGPKTHDVKNLLKNSITLLGKDKDIFRPAIYMTIIKSIRLVIIYYIFYDAYITKERAHVVHSMAILIFSGPLLSYLSMRYKAMTCWMVYETLKGIDTNMSNAKKALKGQGVAIFLIFFVDLLVSSLKNTNNESENGIVSMLKGLFLAFIREVWDLIKNFSLPAIVIEKVKIGGLFEKLKLVKKNIPAALAGVLGIDLCGSLVGSLLTSLVLPASFLGAAIGYFGIDLLPQNWVITFGEGKGISINVLPLSITAFFSLMFFALYNSLAHLVKTTYFTIFYVSLTRPQEIQSEIRDEVTHYLDYNGRLDKYNFFASVQSSKDEKKNIKKENDDAIEDLDSKVVDKLVKIIKKNIAKGLSKKKIGNALLKKGYTKVQVINALKIIKKEEK